MVARHLLVIRTRGKVLGWGHPRRKLAVRRGTTRRAPASAGREGLGRFVSRTVVRGGPGLYLESRANDCGVASCHDSFSGLSALTAPYKCSARMKDGLRVAHRPDKHPSSHFTGNGMSTAGSPPANKHRPRNIATHTAGSSSDWPSPAPQGHCLVSPLLFLEGDSGPPAASTPIKFRGRRRPLTSLGSADGISTPRPVTCALFSLYCACVCIVKKRGYRRLAFSTCGQSGAATTRFGVKSKGARGAG